MTYFPGLEQNMEHTHTHTQTSFIQRKTRDLSHVKHIQIENR